MTMKESTNAAPSKPWRGRFSLAALGTSLFTAFLIYLLEITFVISFAALIFSGELASQLPQALGFIIFGDALMVAVIAGLSSYPGMIAVEQDTPGAVLSIVAVAIAAALPGATDLQFATVVMMIVFTTTLTGLLLLALGVFKLGRLVRFLPYPVMGGFLAGTGWLLATGGVGVMTSLPFGTQWLEKNAITHWLPGVILALLVSFATQKIKKPYTFPALLILAGLVFYGIAGVTQTSIVQLQAEGWLLDAFSSGSVWQFPLRPAIVSQVDWGVLLRQIPALAPAAIISVIALLLNTSGLELIVKKDIDLNRELVTAGIGNLVAGPLGGLIGYQSISLSALNQTMSGGKRQVGLFLAFLIGATLFIGTSVILYIPTFILGSVLFYLGFGLLVEWIYDAWFKFPRIDFLMIASILIIIIVSGFLQGILVGLVMAVGMFVVSYSQVSVIKFAFTGREYRSRVTRNPQAQHLLETHGDQLYLLKLEGFIFFGTANGIFSQVRAHIQETPRAVKYVLLDFAKVSGVDSTGMLSFNRMMQWCQEEGITLGLAGLTGRAQAQFQQEKALQESARQEGTLHFFADLDHGLEWCENALLTTHGDKPEKTSLVQQLTALSQGAGAETLLPFLHRQEYGPGEYLILAGDAPDFVYFIESGQVTAQLEPPGQAPVRLETMYGGRTVGELGFYLGTTRTACVVADAPSIVYALSTTDLHRMETDAPEAASLFHRIIVLLLSERVAHLTRTVGALERA